MLMANGYLMQECFQLQIKPMVPILKSCTPCQKPSVSLGLSDAFLNNALATRKALEALPTSPFKTFQLGPIHSLHIPVSDLVFPADAIAKVLHLLRLEDMSNVRLISFM